MPSWSIARPPPFDFTLLTSSALSRFDPVADDQQDYTYAIK
ncbi:hypothetical protein Pd630_LPD17015 (plasmid) [Rhodococcus opacus PD630]|nr:hypothetical protein Pd630_LPD17015 [Rhodococcus opacus PD630]